MATVLELFCGVYLWRYFRRKQSQVLAANLFLYRCSKLDNNGGKSEEGTNFIWSRDTTEINQQNQVSAANLFLYPCLNLDHNGTGRGGKSKVDGNFILVMEKWILAGKHAHQCYVENKGKIIFLKYMVALKRACLVLSVWSQLTWSWCTW